MSEPLFLEVDLVRREIDAEMLLTKPIPSPHWRRRMVIMFLIRLVGRTGFGFGG